MISFDTETTGIDFYHGALPFFVTTCDDNGDTTFWEWDVDPLTRKVTIPQEDIKDIRVKLAFETEIVLQNAKFDVMACSIAGIVENWPWANTLDTLIAGHLLASNQPHDLTSMVSDYIGYDIEPYEKKLEKAVKECRQKIQQSRLRLKRAKEAERKRISKEKESRPLYATEEDIDVDEIDVDKAEDLSLWAIAEKDRPDMPSAGESTWKYDTWLPRAFAKHLGLPEDHHYWTVLSDYANVDSASTIALWKIMEQKLRERDLWEIFQTRMKLLPIAHNIERRGVTVSKERLRELAKTFSDKSKELNDTCVGIAKNNYKYDLTLPKSGNNNSLTEFCFGKKNADGDIVERYLDLPVVGWTDTGNPSLDKNAIETYLVTLPEGSPQLTFVQSLGDKRKRDTAISYMSSYERYWIPLGVYNRRGEQLWYLLHPSLNPTGTDTLRWSSSNPNEQNISKREGFNLRFCFGPAPGREWWSLDAKNIELRIPAYKSSERDLIDLFERPKEAPYYGSTHLLNFHTVYPDIWENELGTICKDPNCCNGKVVDINRIGPHCKIKFESTWYQYGKNGGFAVQYGAGPATADRAFHRVGSHSKLKSRFNKLEALNQQCIRMADKLGYIETIPDKTVNPNRGYPLLCTRTQGGGVLPTVPLNYYVQGSAMWWMSKAKIRVQEQLDEWNEPAEDYFIVMQVHDELVLDLPKKADPRTSFARSNLPKVKRIQKLMELGGEDIDVPTPVSIEYHPNNWAEGIVL